MEQTQPFKAEAHKLIDSLPEGADWSDLLYEIYVRQEIERGIADLEAGRYQEHEEVKAKFGISPR
ncbi:MAG: hypothetical protein JSS75_09940 [Bacteroidetes bacterium]|nr:hypothetical protein [Bacteroidota bacterium]